MVTNERGYDVVTSGAIVGGEYTPWAIFYDGRQQAQKQYSPTEDAAIDDGKKAIEKLKSEYCHYPFYLYPDVSKWEIRIYN